MRKDSLVSEREGLSVRCIRGDMANLACFADNTFDLIFHPVSNVFVPDPLPVWAGCHRVLRAGGVLLSGVMNPDVFLFDHDEADKTGELKVKYQLPYSHESRLGPERLKQMAEAGEPLEYSHSLTTQIGGQTDAGFMIAGLFDDGWFDDTWPFANHAPVCIAIRALRP